MSKKQAQKWLDAAAANRINVVSAGRFALAAIRELKKSRSFVGKVDMYDMALLITAGAVVRAKTHREKSEAGRAHKEALFMMR